MAMFGLLLFGALYRVFFGQAKSLQKQLFVEAAAVDGVRPMTRQLPPRAAEHVHDRHRAVRAAVRRRHHDAGRPRLHRARPAAARADLGWHDPGRRAVHLPAALDDGARPAASSRSRSSPRTPSPTCSSGGAATPPPLVALRRKEEDARAEYGSRWSAAPQHPFLPRHRFRSSPSRTLRGIEDPHGAPVSTTRRLVGSTAAAVDGDAHRPRPRASGSTAGPRSSPACRCGCGPARSWASSASRAAARASRRMPSSACSHPACRCGRAASCGTAPTSRTPNEKMLAQGARSRDRVHLAGADSRPRPDVHDRLAARPRRSSACAASVPARPSASPVSCSTTSASSTRRGCSRATRIRSPAAWRSASRSRSPSPARRACWSRTSRRQRSMSRSRPRSSRCCADSSPSAGCRSSS